MLCEQRIGRHIDAGQMVDATKHSQGDHGGECKSRGALDQGVWRGSMERTLGTEATRREAIATKRRPRATNCGPG
jgi:hypothetical protein